MGNLAYTDSNSLLPVKKPVNIYDRVRTRDFSEYRSLRFLFSIASVRFLLFPVLRNNPLRDC